MIGTISARLAKLEGRAYPDTARSLTIMGGRKDQVDAFLASFGVQRSERDHVEHVTDRSDEMKLTYCSDMRVVLAYVGKCGKSLLNRNREAP